MHRRSRNTNSDALAGAEVGLRAIMASTDAFPPLKISCVCCYRCFGDEPGDFFAFVYPIDRVLIYMLFQKPKSNKEACKRVADRSAQIVQDIWRQAKDFGIDLPVEAQESIVQIEQLFQDIIIFMKGLKEENYFQRFVRQNLNQGRIERYEKLLNEAISLFSANLQLGLHRLHLEFAEAERIRHDAVLDVSRVSKLEREQLLRQILAKSGHGDMEKHLAMVLVFF